MDSLKIAGLVVSGSSLIGFCLECCFAIAASCSDSDLPNRSGGPVARRNREQRKFHAEGTTTTFLAGNFDLGIMCGADRLHDGETQSRSTAGTRASFVCAVEAFEHVGQSLKRNAGAIIGDV